MRELKINEEQEFNKRINVGQKLKEYLQKLIDNPENYVVFMIKRMGNFIFFHLVPRNL